MADRAVLAFPRGVSDPTCPRGHVIETTTDHRLLWHLENMLAVSATTDLLRDEQRLLSAYLLETCQHHWHDYDGDDDFGAYRQCLWCNDVVIAPQTPVGVVAPVAAPTGQHPAAPGADSTDDVLSNRILTESG